MFVCFYYYYCYWHWHRKCVLIVITAISVGVIDIKNAFGVLRLTNVHCYCMIVNKNVILFLIITKC